MPSEFKPVTQQRALQLLILFLRFGGVVLCLAFGAMLLPADWMAASHRWLGMGEFPHAPLTDYLIRSISALYGFHGVLVLLVAGDPLHYQRIVRYLGVMDIVFGLMMIAIDVRAGMPTMWTMFEGPPLVGLAEDGRHVLQGGPAVAPDEGLQQQRAERVDDEQGEQRPQHEQRHRQGRIAPDPARGQGFAISRTQRSTTRLRLAPA